MLYVLLLAAVINLFLQSLQILIIDAYKQSLILESPLPFFDTYSQCHLFVCKALCIVSFPLVHLLVFFPLFILLIKFLLPSLVSRSFLIYLKYSYFFFHFCLFDDVHFQYSQKLVSFFFLKHPNSFLGACGGVMVSKLD